MFSPQTAAYFVKDTSRCLGRRSVVGKVLENHQAIPDYAFSVAPMMDYTDRSIHFIRFCTVLTASGVADCFAAAIRHLRFLLRLISKRATLYTEMVTANTLIHNEDLNRWLAFNAGGLLVCSQCT